MEVTLEDGIARRIGGRQDAEELANSVLSSYLNGEFIRKSEIAGMVVTKPYKRSAFQAYEAFDAASHEFEGVVVEGTKESDSLFIPSQRLHQLLSENQVLLVMRSPRTKPTPVTKAETSFTPAHIEDDQLQ